MNSLETILASLNDYINTIQFAIKEHHNNIKQEAESIDDLMDELSDMKEDLSDLVETIDKVYTVNARTIPYVDTTADLPNDTDECNEFLDSLDVVSTEPSALVKEDEDEDEDAEVETEEVEEVETEDEDEVPTAKGKSKCKFATVLTSLFHSIFG